jgi:hypothetical protein
LYFIENVKIPSGYRASEATNAIRSATASYGRLWEKRLYFDSRKASEVKTDRLNLDLSGFTLVDCPTRGKKETLDKKMIVDILGFAWERVSRGISACVVLISSDGDYSYTLSKLRDIGVCTVVIHGRLNVTADVLLDCCDVAMSWHHVLYEDDEAPPSALHLSPIPSHHEDVSRGEGLKFSASGEPLLDLAALVGVPSGAAVPVLARESSAASSIAAAEGAFQLICHCVDTIQRRNAGAVEGAAGRAEWATDTAAALMFYSKSGERRKSGNRGSRSGSSGYYKTERQRAIAAGFLETGRMELNSRHIVACDAAGRPTHLPPHGGKANSLSKELYVRLTAAGKQLQKGVWVGEDEVEVGDFTPPLLPAGGVSPPVNGGSPAAVACWSDIADVPNT